MSSTAQKKRERKDQKEKGSKMKREVTGEKNRTAENNKAK